MLEGAGHSLAEAGIDSKGASLRTATLTHDRKGANKMLWRHNVGELQ